MKDKLCSLQYFIYVMTAVRGVADFIYFLPFLFSLYHYPEHSRMSHDSPDASDLTYTPDHPGMT